MEWATENNTKRMKKHECQFCGKKLICKNKEDIKTIIDKHEKPCEEKKRKKREEIENS